MKKILLAIVLALGVASMSTAPVQAVNSPVCEDLETSGGQNPDSSFHNAWEAAGCDEGKETAQNSPKIASAMNIVFFVIGVISVIVLIYGGVRYMLAQGLAAELSQAQHTIIYGVVGLVVSLSGWAIVSFIIDRM